MAQVFLYSKRFTHNGDPVAPVSMSDRMLVSVPVTKTPEDAPYGYRTVRGTLNEMKNYFVEDLRTNGLGKVITIDDSITGDGLSVETGLAVNKKWVSERYIPANYFPISQVGDMNDFTLPISGSYFSVTYPYGNDRFSQTAYVEGNGDLRILRHASNGEDFRVVYSLIRDYRNSTGYQSNNTDTVYEPPGLGAGEFVHNVYPASDKAMLIEIWNATGFICFAGVILNGTLQAQYHQITRFPIQVFEYLTGFSGTVNIPNIVRRMRTRAPGLFMSDGKFYIAYPQPPEGTNNPTTIRVVTLDGNRFEVLTGWSSRSVAGYEYRNTSDILLCNKVATYDPNDKDTEVYFSDPSIYFTGYTAGTSTTHGFHCAVGVEGNGIVSVVCSRYVQVSTPGQMLGYHPEITWLLDIRNRTFYPHPSSMTFDGRGYQWDKHPETTLPTQGPNMPRWWETYHYWVHSLTVQLLNSGDVLRHFSTAGSTDVTPYTGVFINPNGGPTPQQSADWSGRVNAWFKGNHTLNATPPTPLVPGGTMAIVPGGVFTINTDPRNTSNWWTPGSYSRLIGSSTAREYNLLSNNHEAERLNIRGYELNPQRRLIQYGGEYNRIMSQKQGNTCLYHTGVWGSSAGDNWVAVHKAQILDDFNLVGDFKISQATWQKIDNWVRGIVSYPSGFVPAWENTGSPANLADPHSGIGRSWGFFPLSPVGGVLKALVRVSFSMTNPDRNSGGTWFGYFVTNYTVNRSGDNYEITDVSLTAANVPTWSMQFGASKQTERLFFESAGQAVDIRDANNMTWMTRGGNGSANSVWSDTGLLGRQSSILLIQNGVVTRNIITGFMDMPTIHPEYGMGVIRFAGLAALYSFHQMNVNTLEVGEVPTCILTSARPAAGFSFTVTAPFDVSSLGVQYKVGLQTLDLTAVDPDPRNKTFNLYVFVTDGSAELIVTQGLYPESNNYIYIGYVRTTETEISEINAVPLTRWDTYRTSAKLIGKAIPVSTGVPGGEGKVMWGNSANIPLLFEGPSIQSVDVMPGRSYRIYAVGGGGGGGGSVYQYGTPAANGSHGGATKIYANGQLLLEALGGAGGVGGRWYNNRDYNNGYATNGYEPRLTILSASMGVIGNYSYARGRTGVSSTTQQVGGLSGRSIETLQSHGRGGGGANGIGINGLAFGGAGAGGAGAIIDYHNDTGAVVTLRIEVAGGGARATMGASNAQNGGAGAVYMEPIQSFNSTYKRNFHISKSMGTYDAESGMYLVNQINLRQLYTDANGVTGDDPSTNNVYFIVDPGVAVISRATGQAAIEYGVGWPDTKDITVLNYGEVYGAGGEGTTGTDRARNGGAAIRSLNGFSSTVHNYGVILAGGGGSGSNGVPGGGGAPFGLTHALNGVIYPATLRKGGGNGSGLNGGDVGKPGMGNLAGSTPPAITGNVTNYKPT